MSISEEIRTLKVRYPRAYSHHCFLDEDGWYGSCGVYFGRYTFLLRHRYSGKVLWEQTVWYWQRGYSLLVQDWRKHVAKFVKRLKETDRGHLVGGRADDPVFAGQYPALAEHLTLDWLEGAARQTSTLGISVDGGRWKGRLADRENALVLFVSGDSFEGVLGALEAALNDPEADWREDQYAKRPGGRKK